MDCNVQGGTKRMNINSSNDFSFLFGNTGNATNSTGFSLSDYASLKNGSYKKVLNNYYAKVPQGTTQASGEEQEKGRTELNQIRTDATSLKSAAEALMDGRNSIYEKVTKKDADGNETTDYDREKILDSLKNFVKGYNALVDSAADSNDKSILRNTLHMINMTKKNRNMLSKLGIQIDKDNKLSVKEDDVKKADITTLRTMFKGQGSYASNVVSYAGRIDSTAATLLKQNGTYTAKGSYESSDKAGTSGSIFDSFL